MTIDKCFVQLEVSSHIVKRNVVSVQLADKRFAFMSSWHELASEGVSAFPAPP